MNLPEIAQAVGIILGSGAASYFTAKTVVRNRGESAPAAEPPQSPLRALSCEGVLDEIRQLSKRTEIVEAELLTSTQAAREARASADAAVTVEEFEAYARMDLERRERIISAMGELRGQLDLVLKRM